MNNSNIIFKTHIKLINKPRLKISKFNKKIMKFTQVMKDFKLLMLILCRIFYY